jgi:hypothetical protein
MAGRAAKYQILARARWKKQPLAARNAFFDEPGAAAGF